MTPPAPPRSDGQRRELEQRLRAGMEPFIKLLVQRADKLLIKPAWVGDSTLMLRLTTPVPADVGRLVGKRGETINALRRLATAAGALEGIVAFIEIASDKKLDQVGGAPK